MLISGIDPGYTYAWEDEVRVNKDDAVPTGPVLQKVTRSRPRRGSRSRKAPGFRTTPSGVSETNRGGQELFDQVADAHGVDRNAYDLDYAADPATGMVGAYVVPAGTPGADAVRHDLRRKTTKFYLGGVLDEHPDLTPLGPQFVPIAKGPDSNGVVCILFSLKATLDVNTGARKAAATRKANAAKQETA